MKIPDADTEIERAMMMLRNGEVEQACRIYYAVQATMLDNRRALRAFAAVDRSKMTTGVSQDPSRFDLDQLVKMMNGGRFGEAATLAGALIGTYPGSFTLWTILGASSAQNNQIDLAVMAFAVACEIKPCVAEAHSNLGNALKVQGQYDASIEAYARALSLKPDLAGVHYNLGLVLAEQGKLDEAAACYNRALLLDPLLAEVCLSLGSVLRAQGDRDAAFACLRRGLAIKPNFVNAHFELGVVLSECGQLDEALASFQGVLALSPDHFEAHRNIGNVLCEQGRLDQAIASFRHALWLKPDYAEAEVQMLHQQQHICDWSGHDGLALTCARFAASDNALVTFPCLAMTDDLQVQLRLSRKWAAARYNKPVPPLPARAEVRPDRIRIGYFGSDFHDHATIFLMAGLLREQDTAHFEVYIYSYGHDASGDWRKHANRQFAQFLDIANLATQAAVDLVRAHALDIAIDLKGYTARTRLDLFQHRLAPVQISYLGYPGSLATDFIDYIVADPVVIPEAARAYYSESVILLPHSYQPNDNQRPIAETVTTRADFGLPEHGVVLCCFNGSYKISPREFDIWMRVMREVEGSVLWLFRSNRWCEANLRKEAAARGIAPERLVFAERADHAQHLARHKHADLFLDTFNVNAHTTASDALWAGLPVVTRVGQQFAARVSASLLTAVGLPELIAHSDADYEALILELAADPVRLAAIRAKLAANRLTHPLFDTQQYTRDFEAGLQRAYDLWFTGQSPQDIRIG